MSRPRRILPLIPLLRAYEAAAPNADDLAGLPVFGQRFHAIAAARDGLAAQWFLETASESAFVAALIDFYEAVVSPPLHSESVAERAGFVRFALNHIMRGRDPLMAKIDRILLPAEMYYVPGLGPSFWSAILEALDPISHPAWLPATLAGLQRLGLLPDSQARPGEFYSGLIDGYARIRFQQPAMSALMIDHFLLSVAAMTGRELSVSSDTIETLSAESRLKAVIDEERRRVPLRQRLKDRGKTMEDARSQLETGLHDGHAGKILAALTTADPAMEWPRFSNGESFDDALTIWVGRLWEADDPFEILANYWKEAPFPAFGLGLPASVLHLRTPAEFPAWNDLARQGYATLDDAFDESVPPAERYRLFVEGANRLRDQFQIHPYELSGVLSALAVPGDDRSQADFAGFCDDSFRFLDELSENNNRAWMDCERDRYQFAVREPMVELCEALAERYIRPVLGDLHGWRLDSEAKTTHCLSSICKNNYGRSSPYETALWFAYYRPEQGSKRDDAQLFARLEATDLSFGLYLGRNAKAAGERFRQNLEHHADALFTALSERGAFERLAFAHGLHLHDSPSLIHNADDLRRWATGKTLTISRHLLPDSALLRSDELVGEILLAFDRLIPIYACAVAEDPSPWLRRKGEMPLPPPFTDHDFALATHLNGDWLTKAKTLLDLKRQLILQGVPGTGKTHVARTLARLLTRGRDDTIRLVQFHPGYSYEEFVEGIRAKSVESNGRHDVTYPVEDGLLCQFATEAARHPAEPHVLLIDEINRGNLPRIFGELLYLLEYRNQTVGLPYSRRDFHLPSNLYLIGTMNAADRSVALIDQALRRRFSFLEMPPDPGVLAAWLVENPPHDGEEFAQTVVALFEGLNLRLRNDLGVHCQVGHSYFMVPNLDEERLRVVWDHHVWPLLNEYLSANPDRLANYEFDRLMHGKKKREKV